MLLGALNPCMYSRSCRSKLISQLSDLTMYVCIYTPLYNSGSKDRDKRNFTLVDTTKIDG